MAGSGPSRESRKGWIPLIEEAGFVVEERDFHEQLHYESEAWLNMVFTYSDHLPLDQEASVGLRARLSERIGGSGVSAENRGVALICARPQRVGQVV
jgi:hypothetical protein